MGGGGRQLCDWLAGRRWQAGVLHGLPPRLPLLPATCLARHRSTSHKQTPDPTPPPHCGQIPFTHFLALSGAEFAGALLGACLVWLHFLPHFKSVPEPPVSTADELLLRR